MNSQIIASLSGVIPPVITPLDAEGRLDQDAEHRHIQRLIAAGVSGIFVLGSSGEGPWLPVEVQASVVRTARDATGGAVPVLAGVIEPSTPRAREAAAAVLDAGADMLVVASPYYFPVGNAAQVQHISNIVNEFEVPTLVYNIPQTTHNPISPEVLRELIELDNVIGIKDSAGDWDIFVEFLGMARTRPLAILQGAEDLISRSIAAGAAGAVPGLSNVLPDLFMGLVSAAKAGDLAEAERLQGAVDRAGETIRLGYWLETLKYAASLQGFGSGRMVARPPEISPEAREAISVLVESHYPGTGRR